MPHDDFPCSHLASVRAIAADAGRRIAEIYAHDFNVTEKSDGSPVTAADHAAHHAIVDGLSRLTPGLPVLSEESARIDYAERAHWQRYWLVDPLDGTREFVKRSGDFTVNIALIDAGRPVLGVVYAPITQVCYFACRGGGAFKQEPSGQPVAIHVRSQPGPRPRVAASRSHAGEHLAGYLARLGEHELVSIGSSLKICLVAEGAADLYPRLGRTMEWDTAAAQCVVEEAGGVMLDPQRRPLRYNKLSLANPWFIVSADDREWTRYLPPMPIAD